MTPARSVGERLAATPPRRRRLRRGARVGPLVVATRPGDPTRGALHVAELLARRDRANAHVVDLLRPVDVSSWGFGTGDAGALQEGMQRQRRDRLRRRVHEAVGRSALFSTEVLVGASIRAFGDAARRTGAEYVLVGLDDPKAPDRVLTEQIVLQVARVMERPVLAVPRGCTALPTRALAAVRGDTSGLRAARAAARLLAPGGTLTLAHVASDRPEVGPADARTPARAAGRTTADLEEIASALREAHGVTVETAMLRGEPAAALLAHAADRRCDLIACGMSRESARRGPGHDGILAALLRGAPGAVLVVPTSAAARGGNAPPRLGGDSVPVPAPAAAIAAEPDARSTSDHTTCGGTG